MIKRLICLFLAVKMEDKGTEAEWVVKTAEKFYGFLVNQKENTPTEL